MTCNSESKFIDCRSLCSDGRCATLTTTDELGGDLRFFSLRHPLSIILCLVFILGSSVRTGAEPAEPRPRDVLWHIVTTCIDVHKADYCKRCYSPRTDSACGHDRACDATTEVWEETTDYITIRDIKMCGCDKDFVHGLVIPRTRITGVEDPRRPDGIWNFAWAEARKHIQNDAAIALVVNPANWRSQDQLHVHIVRLLSHAHRRFSDTTSVRVHSLGSVWHQAANKAARLGLQDYGVLVTKQQEGDFLVQVEEKSPEKMYTQWECR